MIQKGETEMVFEIYHPITKKEKVPKPIVRLSNNSLILNKVSREQLNSPERVELAFDSDTNIMRIRPSADGENTVKKTKVAAPGFFKQFEISATGKYFADYNQDENALYVNLG
jgi:hypothetical protein